MTGDTTQTLRLVIHGRVQGVFFRDSMRNEALQLGVSGWVRNCADGTVEAVVQGRPENVDALLRWARRGPELAQVDGIESEPADGDYSGFEIRYGAR